MTRVGIVVLGWCVLVVLASTAVTPVEGDSPTVTVAVDGESVTAGSETVVQSDPAVTVVVESSSPVELVDVRVDGEIRWSRAPDTRSVEETVPLELDSGAAEVTVVVNAGGVESVSATVIKDDLRPRVAYTSPFETTALAGVPAEVRVETGEITLAGEVVDHVGVERVSIAREYAYTSHSGEDGGRASRVQHRISEPNGSVSQSLLLGDGRNNVTARYTDRFGQLRVDEFVVVVDDTTAPVIDVSAPAQTSAETVRVTGTVRDGVKVSSLAVQAPDGSGRVLVQTDAEPDPDRLAVELDETVALREGTNEIIIEASDPAGNTATETLVVDVAEDIPPQVTLTTGVTDGRVQVDGRVDGDSTRVTLESIDGSTGERLDVVRVHDSDAPTAHVPFEASLAASDTSTTVRVLVTDGAGEQHETTVVATSREAETNASQGSSEGERESRAVAENGASEGEAATESAVAGQDAAGEESSRVEAMESETTGDTQAPTSRRDRLFRAVRGVVDTARTTTRGLIQGALGGVRERLPLVVQDARSVVTGPVGTP